MAKDFSNAFSDVKPINNGGNDSSSNTSTIDWNAFNAKVLDVMEGVGSRNMLGYISQVVDLGLQELDEQVVVWDDKNKKDHAWRFEPRKDKDGKEIEGQVGDPTASLKTLQRKGKDVECLVYQPQPVRQAAISVDFPENMFPYGEFFEGSDDKPYRVIIGENGFLTKERTNKAGTWNIVAKPFNLKHINVNRQKDGAKPHYALAKNGMLYNIAEFTDSLDGDGNFHSTELGKLIGKPLMFDVNVAQDDYGVKIDVKPSGRLAKRDQKAWDEEVSDLMKDEYLGFVLFDGNNDEETLKKLNNKIINTLKMSPDFESSGLKKELEKVGKLGNYTPPQSNSESTSSEESTNTQEEQKPSENVVQEPVANNEVTPSPDMIDFDDDK